MVEEFMTSDKPNDVDDENNDDRLSIENLNHDV